MPTFFDKTIMKPFVAITPKWLSPNAITIFRFISVPVVILLFYFGNYKVGAFVFFVAAFSDALDGAVARTRNQTSEFGETFDPLADKLLILSSASFLLIKFLPIWLFGVILFLEIVIVLLAIFDKFLKEERVKSNLFGKIKMFLQSVGILLLLIYSAFWQEPVVLDVAFYVLFVSIAFATGSLLFGKGRL